MVIPYTLEMDEFYPTQLQRLPIFIKQISPFYSANLLIVDYSTYNNVAHKYHQAGDDNDDD